MTLIELLVVIIILTTLVSAAIPILSPTNDDRRLREAARMVNAFISTAQANAIATQRPFGVGIKRLSKDTSTPASPRPEDNAVSIELYYIEQPSPYVGFNEQSQARVALYTAPNNSLYGGATNLVVIQFVTPGTNIAQTSDGLPAAWDADQLPSGVIRPGDVMVINGTRYQLLDPDPKHQNINDSNVPAVFDSQRVFLQSNTGTVSPRNVVQVVAEPINDSGQMIDIHWDNDGYPLGTDRLAFSTAPSKPSAPYWTNPAPYKILRQPAKTSAEPLQMPEGSAIDLRASGLGDAAFFYIGPTLADNDGVNNSDDILIMFAPEGRVSRLSLNPNGLNLTDKALFDKPIVDNIFLLVGRRENCPPPDVASDKTIDINTFRAAPPTAEQLAELKKPVNWLRGESRWVVIGSQSGRVVTIENSTVDPRAIINDRGTAASATEELRTLQIVGTTNVPGAREFIKEMKQLGGH
jgi:type II secretory pathway pseudopilin PulG